MCLPRFVPDRVSLDVYGLKVNRDSAEVSSSDDHLVKHYVRLLLAQITTKHVSLGPH